MTSKRFIYDSLQVRYLLSLVKNWHTFAAVSVNFLDGVAIAVRTLEQKYVIERTGVAVVKGRDKVGLKREIKAWIVKDIKCGWGRRNKAWLERKEKRNGREKCCRKSEKVITANGN